MLQVLLVLIEMELNCHYDEQWNGMFDCGLDDIGLSMKYVKRVRFVQNIL